MPETNFDSAEAAITPPQLKNCLGCGGKPKLIPIQDYLGNGAYRFGAKVTCAVCGASTGTIFKGFYLKTSPYCWIKTEQLLACRRWNSHQGDDTKYCHQCGISVPHRHEFDGENDVVLLSDEAVKGDVGQ